MASSGWGGGGTWGRRGTAQRATQANTRRRAARPEPVKAAERAYMLNVPSNQWSSGAYHGWMNAAQADNYGQGAAPSGPRFGGGGGGGRGGGGGGGGGGGALTQAMFDQMLRALGTSGPRLDLPEFRGENLAAFDPRMFNDLRAQLNTAVTADQAAVQAGSQQATQALQGNYTNAYANAPVAQAPQAEQIGTALQGTAGGGGDQAAVAAQSNAAGASDQASFANLLNVLAATDQSTQNSRLNQVALDQQTAMRNIGAQRTGLGAGIGMAQGRAQQDWAQRDAERRYQNSLMRQQWEREEAQGNWQQRNEMISSRLTPLLELLGSTAGTNLNAGALEALLAGWQR